MQVFHWFRAYYLIKNQLIYIYIHENKNIRIKFRESKRVV